MRLGFVVKPNDGARLQSIFEVNTCLWGGRFNPIIPYLSAVPTWWERQGVRFDTARQIMNGYVDFFEPDFLVEAEPGLGASLGYDANRVLQLDDVLARRTDRGRSGVGLEVIDLYTKLYREEFQFVRRRPNGVMHATTNSPFRGFAGCLFGAFPGAEDRSYFQEAFEAAFEPTRIELTAATLEQIYRARGTDQYDLSALVIGSANISVSYADRGEPVLFVLDATQPRDLLDFWNLRASRRNILPVPVQWLDTFAGFCRDFIVRGYRPLPGNPNGVMQRVTSMFSRSISSGEIDRLHTEHLRTDVVGANVLQDWYPPIWREPPEIMARSPRPTLEAMRHRSEVALSDQAHVRFDALEPEFAERFGGDHRWANVVRIRNWSSADDVTTVFPTDPRVDVSPRMNIGSRGILSTTEGLVAFAEFKGESHLWEIPTGAAAISAWLKKRGITAEPSEAGRPTQQIIQTLKGFRGVSALAHPDIVRLLDHMARRPVTHAAHWQEFKQKIKNAVGDNIWRSRVFETLVDRKAVELGYELRCPKCGSWSWHALAALGPEVSCALCLRAIPFPVADPSNSSHARWAYRVIGPFALPDYAGGGYAAALAMRVFGGLLSGLSGPEVTWAAGHNLTFGDGQRAEADFILWHQHKDIGEADRATEIVFGEAKSFGKESFKDEDIERMRMLALRFPGAYCVFATLKEAEQLSKREVSRIRKFAEWGREYHRDLRRTRTPVIMLTGTELFAPYRLDQAWKDKEGRHAQLIEPAYISTARLQTIADLTQQLYLDMPPYSEWRQQRWEARRKRRDARSGG